MRLFPSSAKRSSLPLSFSLLLPLAATTQAAPITFAAPTNIAADADVLTIGSLVYAHNFTGASKSVNGVAFASIAAAGNANITFTNINTQSASGYTSTATPFTDLSPAYKALLIGGTYNGTANSTGTVTLNNLTIGRKYTLQLWVGDPRAGATATRTETIASTGGNSQILDFNVGNASGGVGQFVIGTFIADATTQSFTLAATTGGVPQLNAIQLREAVAFWSGEVDGNWDEATTNFSGLSFATAKTSMNRVLFRDTSEGGAAVTQNQVTLQAGGVSGANVTVANSAVNYTFTSADSNGISGNFTLTKNGTGSLTLAGAHTFTGLTTLAGGTLALGDPNALQGSRLSFTSGALTFNGISTANIPSISGSQPITLTNDSAGPVALTVGSDNITSAFTGTFSGAGSLTKIGTGIFNITGVNNPAGGIFVMSGGVGTLGGSISALTLDGGNLDISGGGAASSSIGTLTQNSGNVKLDFLATSNDVVNVSGDYLSSGGSIELVPLSAIFTTDTPITLVNYAGTLTGTPSVITGSRATATVDYGTGSNSSITATLTGGPTSLFWTGANGTAWQATPVQNWSDGINPERFYAFDSVTFDDDAANSTPVLTETIVPGAITFDNTETDYLLSGTGSISGSATNTKLGTGKLTVTNVNTRTGATSVIEGILELGGTAGTFGNSSPITVYTGAKVILNRTGPTDTFSAAVSGAGSLEKLNAGTTSLISNLGSFTGDLTISAGILQPLLATAIPSGAGKGNVINNATLNIGTLNITVNGLSGTGVVDKTGTAATTLTLGANDATSTFDGTIQNSTGTLNVTKTGAGTITLTGTNTYSGTTTVAANGGTLIVTSPAALGSGNISIPKVAANTGTLALAFTGTNTLANAFAGFASTNFTGDTTQPSIENLSGNTTISAPLTVTSGGGNGVYLKCSGGFLTLTGNITQSIATRAAGFGGAGDGLVSGIISNQTGNLFVSKDGTGTWTFTGANTYSGSTTISAGTLQIGNGGNAGTLGTAGVNVGSAGTLAFNRTDDITVPNVISSTGSVEQRGSGKVTLSGANTYSGPTRVLAGTLATTSAFLSDSSAVVIADGAKLSLDFVGTDTVSSLTINDVLMPPGTYGAVGPVDHLDPTHFAGSGVLMVGTPYDLWLANYPSLTEPAGKLKTADPDHDGLTNLVEFALDGNPTVAAASGKIVSKIVTIGADSFLTLTLPVLSTATADPADTPGGPLGLIKGTTKFAIQGSTTLGAWPLEVIEIPAITAGLPSPLSAGYEYRSFRLANPVAGNPTGFLRVSVSE